MDVDGLVLHQRAVPLLRVLARRVEEEPRGDGLADLGEVAARGHHVQLVPAGVIGRGGGG